MSATGRLGASVRWLITGDERGAVSLTLPPGWAAVRPQLLGVLLLLIVNVALLAAFTWPAWNDASRADRASRRGEQAQDTLGPELERARNAYGKVLVAEAGLAELRERVGARSGTVSEIVATLRAAVDAAGLSVERIGYQTQVVDELQLLQLQVDMPVRGRYRQVRSFLDSLLDGPTFLVVERINVSTPNETDPRQTLMIQLGASVFADPTRAEGGARADSVPSPERLPRGGISGDPVVLAQQLQQQLASLPPIPVAAGEFVLNLERLDIDTTDARTTRRNLFAFAVDDRPRSATPIDEIVTPVVRPPPEPVMPYQLLGITRTSDALLATLGDGDHVHVLREGEMLPEGYRVLTIDLLSVELEAGDRVVRLSLRREENQ